MPLVSPEEVRARLNTSFGRFLSVYGRFGGHNYYGWDHQDDPRNFRGPTFWTEGDCAFRFGVELEAAFPLCVHYEFPIAAWSIGDFDKQIDKREYVDLVVTDLHDFVEDDTSQERFWAHEHALFVEVKYLSAGSSKTWRHDAESKVPSVYADAARLERHLERGHCLAAACLVVDDDGLFEELYDPGLWPPEVALLLANPAALTRKPAVEGFPRSSTQEEKP